jgi:hypothetical protein
MMINSKLSDDVIILNSNLLFEVDFETLSSCLAFISHILLNFESVENNFALQLIEYLEENDLDYNVVHNLKLMDSSRYRINTRNCL